MSRHYRSSIDEKQIYRIVSQVLDGVSFEDIAKMYSHSYVWASKVFEQTWSQYKTDALAKKFENYITDKKNSVLLNFLKENKESFLLELERRLLKKAG